MQEINFQRKSRGLKPPNSEPVETPADIEELINSLAGLTRRHVVGKSGEAFDPLGLYEPFKAALKRSLTRLNHLDWNDTLNPEETSFWIETLKLWPKLAQVSFPRSVIPSNVAYPLVPRIICLADASADCGGVCLYLSFKLLDGSWSSQILAAKSRLLKFSVPRNELEMIELASELVFATVVSVNLPFNHIIIGTDSLVALSWCMNERIRHKVYVMNRVLAIRRFIAWTQSRVGPSCPIEVVHIPGSVNSADLLTKGNPSIEILLPDSPWQLGYPWMLLDLESMPLTRYEDISLSQDQVKDFLDEAIVSDTDFFPVQPLNSHYFAYHISSDVFEGNAFIVNPDSISPSFSVPWEGIHNFHVNSKLPYLIDVIHSGWKKSNLVLAHCIKFGLKLIHSTHMNTHNLKVQRLLLDKCPICILSSDSDIQPNEGIVDFKFVSTDYDVDFTHNPQYDVDYSDRFRCGDDILPDNTAVGTEVSPDLHPIINGKDSSTQLNAVMPVIDFLSPKSQQIIISSCQVILDSYWNANASAECLKQIPKKDLHHYHIDRDSGFLFYKGRVAKDQKITVQDLDLLHLNFFDSDQISFHAPCLMATSDIFYAYAIHCHHESVPHSGPESTLREISKRFHVVNPRKVLSRILKDCIKCKIIKKQVLTHEMANHSSVRFTMAPPFTFIQCDLAQHFHTKVRASGRQTMKAPALVICCLMTGAVNIHMMENWSTEATVHALTRHGARYGFPSTIYIDSGSQLKALKDVTFCMQDLIHTLHKNLSIELIVAPPKSHVSQGRVERRIGLLRDMLLKLGEPKFLQSFLSWETLFSTISNYLNDLPIAKASARSVERLEYSVLTANRLLVGRNNSRSLAGPLILDFKLSSMFERSLECQETFFRLLHKQLFLLIPKSKWYSSDQVCVNDIVLFFLDDSPLKSRSRPWHLGRIVSVSGGRVMIEYTIGMSHTKKLIERSKRSCCRIASEEELEYNSHKHMHKIINNSN